MNVKHCNFCDAVIKNTDINQGKYYTLTIQKVVDLEEFEDLKSIMAYVKDFNKNNISEQLDICETCYKIIDMMLYYRYNKIKSEINSIRRMLGRSDRKNKILGEKI